MATRIEVNVQTGERKEIEWTPPPAPPPAPPPPPTPFDVLRGEFDALKAELKAKGIIA